MTDSNLVVRRNIGTAVGTGGAGGGLILRSPPDIFASASARNTYFSAAGNAAALAEFQANQFLAIVIRSGGNDTFQTYATGQQGQSYAATNWLTRTSAVQGDDGTNAWTPVFAVVANGERRVMQIMDWIGGGGTKPPTGFLASTGIVAQASAATDIRGAAGAAGSGMGIGGITLNQARDAAGQLLAGVEGFNYDADSDALTYSPVAGSTTRRGVVEYATQVEIRSEDNPASGNEGKRVLDIPGIYLAIARKVMNASNTVRGIVLLSRNEDVDETETDTSRVPTVEDAKRLILRLVAANPTGVRAQLLDGITIGDVSYYLQTVEANPSNDATSTIVKIQIGTNVYSFPVADLGLSNRDADSLDITSSTGTNVTIPSATATQAGLLSAADKVNVDNIHDSSGGTGEDNSRLTALEQRTSDIELIPHTGWTTAPTARIAVVPVASFSVDQAAVVGFTYANTFTASSAGNFAIVLRLPHGNSPNSYRLQRTGSSTDPVHGVFHGGGFTQGGSDYVYMTGSLALVSGDTLTLQSVGTVYTTRYDGEVTRLDEHITQTYAHQDNPVRVPALPVGAPTGRQVYLTDAVTHPNENIFSVSVQDLGDFYGATVADFTSIGGPAAASDQAGYPAIMNVARISGIWQHKYIRGNLERRIHVAVRGSIGTPTHIHIAGAVGGLNERFALTVDPDNPAITVGGVVNRVMRTGVLTYDFFQSLAFDHPPNPLSFSLQYAGGFLDDDGTIDSGIDHAIGHYESLGNGQWEGRGEAILNNLVDMLSSASIATKQRLLDALSYEEELHNTTSVRSRNGWVQFQLSRPLVAADDNKKLDIRMINVNNDVTLTIDAGVFRTHTAQGGGANRKNNNRAFTFAIASGDNMERNDEGRGLIYISRPDAPTNNTNILMMLFNDFGTESNQWRSTQIIITLRGF